MKVSVSPKIIGGCRLPKLYNIHIPEFVLDVMDLAEYIISRYYEMDHICGQYSVYEAYYIDQHGRFEIDRLEELEYNRMLFISIKCHTPYALAEFSGYYGDCVYGQVNLRFINEDSQEGFTAKFAEVDYKYLDDILHLAQACAGYTIDFRDDIRVIYNNREIDVAELEHHPNYFKKNTCTICITQLGDAWRDNRKLYMGFY